MTFPRQISLLAFLAFLGLALTGCQPSDPDSPNVKQLTSIAVTPNPVNMVVGGMRVADRHRNPRGQLDLRRQFRHDLRVVRAGGRDRRLLTPAT